MTDKEVIIDGVNVAGCDYVLNNKLMRKQHCPNKSMPYAKETSCVECKSRGTKYNFCKNNPNCYYKQLQRKEQECERLTRDYFKQNEWLQQQAKEIQRLQAENEELKRDNKYKTIKLNKIKNFVKDLMFDVECENWFERFVYCFEDWKENITKQSDRYKQALEEIKEFQQRNCETCTAYKTERCNSACQVFVILTIINEVLKDE